MSTMSADPEIPNKNAGEMHKEGHEQRGLARLVQEYSTLFFMVDSFRSM